jgi:hypothetical protein
MTVIGLKGLNFPEVEYSTLNESINNRTVEITEINEGGSVPTLNIVNNGDLPVLLFDGEELEGAKQNRILNTTILIPEHSKSEIPVSCTEQGRWDYTTPTFKDSSVVASPKLRRAKNVSVSESAMVSDVFKSNQSEVWAEVDGLCDFVDCETPTRAMKDVFEAEKHNLEDYLDKFPPSNQNGVLIFINNEIVGMELLSSEESYKKYHDKIIKSYSLDALVEVKETKNIDYIGESKKFIREIANITPFEKQSVGYGYDNRFVSDNIAGALLTHENAVIHGAFFRKNMERGESDEKVVSSSQRARNYGSY